MQGPKSKRVYMHDPELVRSATNTIRSAVIQHGVQTLNEIDYQTIFSLMSELEFQHAYKRVSRYRSLSLVTVVELIDDFLTLQEDTGKGYHGGHICFLIDVAPAAVMFSGDNRHHRNRDVGQQAYAFFDACGSNNDWTKLSTGFLIGKLVDPHFGRKSLSSSHLEWLTINAVNLMHVREELRTRKSVDRDICEELFSTPSSALREGVL